MKQDDVFKPLDIFKVIQSRRSVRTFDTKPIPEKTLAAIKAYISAPETPFGEDVKLYLIDIESGEHATTSKKCTYNVISGAKWFLAAEVSDEADYALIQVGYALERVLLFATALGLSGCYLGGSFDKERFRGYAASKEGSIVPVVMPIGFKSEKESFIAKVLKYLSKSGSRKEFEDIFFDGDFLHTMNHIQAGEFYPAFEATRLAPSSRNLQPWRIVKDGEAFHFYKYCTGAHRGEFDLGEVDMGIAMCHFALAAADAGFEGEFFTAEKHPDGGQQLDYVATFTPSKAEIIIETEIIETEIIDTEEVPDEPN